MNRGIKDEIDLLHVYGSLDKAISYLKGLSYTLEEAKKLFEKIWIKKEMFKEKDS